MISNIWRKTLYMTIALLLASLLSSCRKDEKEEGPADYTVLVYMAADNNLSSYCEPNMTRMRSAMTSQNDNDRLVVFLDRPGLNPLLLRLKNKGVDTLRVYPEVRSTDSKVLSYVIKETAELFPAKHYGLVMWSHGTGWIPSEALHYAASNLNYAPRRDGADTGAAAAAESDGRRVIPQTRSFGYESVPVTNVYGGKGYTSMDIGDMAAAIPDKMFDYILFDACYMANVEIAYALRRKTERVVSSCYEIVADGFPYHLMTQDLLSGNMVSAAEKFYEYYRDLNVSESQRWQRMGGVSVVETAGLDSLARCFRKIAEGRTAYVMNMPVSGIQHFDRFSRTVFYDLEDVAENICTEAGVMNEFRAQLDRCISYSMSTPYMFQGDPYNEIRIDRYSGLSIYIPRTDYESNQIYTSSSRTNLNAEYLKTEWSRATGYGKK